MAKARSVFTCLLGMTAEDVRTAKDLGIEADDIFHFWRKRTLSGMKKSFDFSDGMWEYLKNRRGGLMARGKKHPLEKWWKKVFDEFKFVFPFWLPWYFVELKRIPEGIQVEDLKVAAADKDEARTVAWTIVDIIHYKEAYSRTFVDTLKESVGSYEPISASWFKLMAGRSFYYYKKLEEIPEEDRVDEKGRPRFIETSNGLLLLTQEERDYIDEMNRNVEADEKARANGEER